MKKLINDNYQLNHLVTIEDLRKNNPELPILFVTNSHACIKSSLCSFHNISSVCVESVYFLDEVSLRYCFMIKDKPYRLDSVTDLAELNGIGVDKFISGLRKQDAIVVVLKDLECGEG